METLENLLRAEDLRNLGEKEISGRFREIAETLMGNYIIKKGEKRYAFVEIEFYLYTSTHQDFITYPRDIEAGRWFFHESGVDITFKSIDIEIETKSSGKKIVTLKDKPQFGGILIRGLYRFPYTDKMGHKIEAKYIFGPHNCVNELWDNFGIFKSDLDEYPVVQEALKGNAEIEKNEIPSYKRHIKIDWKKHTPDSKVRGWAKRLGLEVDPVKIENNFNNKLKEYSTKLFHPSTIFYPYRFFNIIDGENTWKAINHLTCDEKKNMK